MKKYKRLNWTKRLKIEALYNAGHSMRSIARELGYSAATISREVRRGLYDHLNCKTYKIEKRYSAQIAEEEAAWLSTSRGCPIKLGSNYSYAAYVSRQIQHGYSPDEITGRLRKLEQWTVSTTTLYRYIDLGYIPDVTNKNLRCKAKSKRQYQRVTRAKRAAKGPSIEERPKDIYLRLFPGHWEMDCVIGKSEGKGQTLLVLTERQTRYEIICKLRDRTMETVTRTLQGIVHSYPTGTFKTITVDNGSEFQNYAGMKQLVQEVYYCHPYCSSERGSNENANRIIRRFYPKGQSLHRITQQDCQNVQDIINDMPRKILGYSTARERFEIWQATLV